MDAKQQACAHSSLSLACYFPPFIKALWPLRMKLLLLLCLLLPLNSLASSYKELGERGGTKQSALEELGDPTVKTELSAPDFVVKGVGPVACQQANQLDTISVWAYKETNGFYQLIFDNNKLICLRWSSNAEPFANIQP